MLHANCVKLLLPCLRVCSATAALSSRPPLTHREAQGLVGEQQYALPDAAGEGDHQQEGQDLQGGGRGRREWGRVGRTRAATVGETAFKQPAFRSPGESAGRCAPAGASHQGMHPSYPAVGFLGRKGAATGGNCCWSDAGNRRRAGGRRESDGCAHGAACMNDECVKGEIGSLCSTQRVNGRRGWRGGQVYRFSRSEPTRHDETAPLALMARLNDDPDPDSISQPSPLAAQALDCRDATHREETGDLVSMRRLCNII